MMEMIPKLTSLLCFLMIVRFNNGVGLDYFFDALRTDTSCNSRNGPKYCQMKCGLATGYCLQNQCYCLTVIKSVKNGDREHITMKLERVDRRNSERLNNDFQDYNEELGFNDEGKAVFRTIQADDRVNPEYLDTALLIDKPPLRHHIAHFCPNLDVARDCIRTCMKQGKPAFCGKDHVCYCGHKYSSNDKDPETDVSSVYEQFKDMYEKYFGPKYRPEIHV